MYIHFNQRSLFVNQTINILSSFICFLTRRKLVGRTLFITGASRGIGKAIALKAARDGANIVIAAKTADVNPKLPGTIFTAAKESKHGFGYGYSINTKSNC